MKVVSRYILLATSMVLLSGCATPSFRNQEAWDHFVDNTRLVHAAKRSYQLGHNLPDGAMVTWAQLATCLPGHWKPECMEGGVLEPGRLGKQMKCSVHGQGYDSFKRRYLKETTKKEDRNGQES